MKKVSVEDRRLCCNDGDADEMKDEILKEIPSTLYISSELKILPQYNPPFLELPQHQNPSAAPTTNTAQSRIKIHPSVAILKTWRKSDSLSRAFQEPSAETVEAELQGGTRAPSPNFLGLTKARNRPCSKTASIAPPYLHCGSQRNP